MSAEKPKYSPSRPPLPEAPRPVPEAPHAASMATPRRSPPKGRGCLWTVGGVALVAVGIPMLVLPGPGIAAILGGVWMMGRGLGLVKPRQ